ncbi:hypothetical protein QZH41_018643 [Actinostola sp. cb2023]|nr:hypothetical protein QZH41_018643 [Actinostola sp. cb2023]
MLSLQNLQQLKLSCMYLSLVVVFLVGTVLKRLQFLRSSIIKAFDAIAGERLPPEVYWNTLFGAEMFKHVWHSVELDATKRVHPERKALNSPVVSLEDGRYHYLLDYAQNQRPLVVNFGSSTCPVFMKRLEKYTELVAEFKDVADFVIVYIEEAHPQDGWAFENNNSIFSHKSQRQRCSVAGRLAIDHAPCPVLVDTMLDAANMAYGAFPIRLYVIMGDHVVYQGGTGPTGYSFDEVSDWLKENAKSTPIG